MFYPIENRRRTDRHSRFPFLSKLPGVINLCEFHSGARENHHKSISYNELGEEKKVKV
jgi:hypothetical protein